MIMPFETHKISHKVILPLDEFDRDYKDSLLHHTRENLEGKYDEKHGYIIDVNEVVDEINASFVESTPVFFLRVEIETFNPTIGDKVEMTVSKVLSSAVLATASNMGSVIIPTRFLEQDGLEYDAETKSYINEDDEQVVSLGNTVTVELVNVERNCDGTRTVGKLDLK